jgi:N-methylhydantoinase A
MRKGNIEAVREAFHQTHERLYRYRDREAVIQVISIRVVAKVRTPRPELTPIRESSGPVDSVKTVQCWMDGASRQVPLYRRGDLCAGDRLPGPAIIIQDDTTICVLPNFEVNVDRWGNLHLINLEIAG